MLAITGAADHNLLGVCAGGMTSAALLGHLAAVADERVHSASFLVTVLDWSVPSTVGSMVSGPVLQAARQAMHQACDPDMKKLCPGQEGREAFMCLRQNEDKQSAACKAAQAKMRALRPPGAGGGGGGQ